MIRHEQIETKRFSKLIFLLQSREIISVNRCPLWLLAKFNCLSDTGMYGFTSGVFTLQANLFN